MPKSSDLTFSPKANWPWPDIATALAASYRAADEARAIRAARALGCGLIAIIAKDLVGHGKFGEWLKSASLADLKERTVRNYMSAATAWLKQSSLTAGQIEKSAFIEWTLVPVGFNEKVIASCKVWKSVLAYVGERSLWEIYQDEGIARERDAHQQHTPSAGATQLTFEDVKRGWADLATRITALGHVDQSWADLPDDLAWQFLDAAVPVVRNLSTTKNLSKAQRERLLGELTTITTALRSGK